VLNLSFVNLLKMVYLLLKALYKFIIDLWILNVLLHN